MWALSAVFLGLVLVLGELSFGAVGPSRIGMMLQLHGTDPATVAREFDLLAEMHVTWVRASFDWPTIEGNRGEFDWAYPDEVVKQASARRMSVLPILSHTPAWARPAGTTTTSPPDHVSDFAAFAGATAARYAPSGVHTWEIWNEPNINSFWQPAPNANAYGELFRATATSIRVADPNATLLIGGLTSGPDAADGSRIAQRTYVEQLYNNGTAQLADAIAVHPYSFQWPHAVVVVGGLDDVPALHKLMERHGDGGKKVWITEFGAPTGTAADAVSDIEQAMTILHALKLVQKWVWAGPLIYFELRDAGTNPAVDEDNFGVVRRDLSLKIAGKALIAQHIAP
jgi:polysaccharide biosynthesis protein PslG